MDLNYQRMILGYHGCDAKAVARVLAGDDSLDPSRNEYDWLGKGIYFWEHGPQRALDWAKGEAKRAPHKITVPAVLGAYINLGQCFDLLDTANTRMLGRMYPLFRRFVLKIGKPMPKNKAAPGGSMRDKVLRYLDCAVINWSLDQMAADGKNYQTIRGIFVEGRPAFRGAKIMLKSHVQIAVRDPRCIVGFFRPTAGAFIAA
ncbi:MAG: hypothetical protein O2960_28515 [Verrucomicrobia bacterium]|nr:hypothetical protein [Verrucomicrobiota bacterium]